jgi:hypothetical protein
LYRERQRLHRSWLIAVLLNSKLVYDAYNIKTLVFEKQRGHLPRNMKVAFGFVVLPEAGGLLGLFTGFEE